MMGPNFGLIEFIQNFLLILKGGLKLGFNALHPIVQRFNPEHDVIRRCRKGPGNTQKKKKHAKKKKFGMNFRI